MIEIGSRRRRQPAPPHVIFEALTAPDREAARLWMVLLDDEHRPHVLLAEEPTTLVWSSLWVKRPDATVRFDLSSSADGGTDLRWTLHVEEPSPDQAVIGHLRKRLNQLINADLRYSFGQ